jgi:hypothetical protein
MTDTAIEQRDEANLPEQREEAVVRALLSGRTVRSVRKEFNLTLDEIDAIIARTWPVDGRARVRMIMMDCGKLDRLIAEFYRRAIAQGDVAAGTLAVKAMERKHQLTGVEAATRIDLQVITQPKEMRSFERIKAAVYAIARGQQPNGDAAVDQIEPPANDGNGSGELQ